MYPWPQLLSLKSEEEICFDPRRIGWVFLNCSSAVWMADVPAHTHTLSQMSMNDAPGILRVPGISTGRLGERAEGLLMWSPKNTQQLRGSFRVEGETPSSWPALHPPITSPTETHKHIHTHTQIAWAHTHSHTHTLTHIHTQLDVKHSEHWNDSTAEDQTFPTKLWLHEGFCHQPDRTVAAVITPTMMR